MINKTAKESQDGSVAAASPCCLIITRSLLAQAEARAIRWFLVFCFQVVDVETGKILGPGAHGELCIRGPTVTSGIYAGGKQILPVTDEDGFLHSGSISFYS